jgi:hypothetical protein
MHPDGLPDDDADPPAPTTVKESAQPESPPDDDETPNRPSTWEPL